MLGWEIQVYKQRDGGSSRATAESMKGKCISSWLTNSNGLHWLVTLSKAGMAVELGGDGYPSTFTGTAEVLIPEIAQNLSGTLPGTIQVYQALSGFIDARSAMTVAELVESVECRMGEWLLIHAWDQS